MTKINLLPIAGTRNKVFIKTDAVVREKLSAGGIFMIDTTPDKKPTTGIVIAISEKDENGTAPNIQVGDHVMFSEFAGQIYEHENQEFLVMKEADIFAKILN